MDTKARLKKIGNGFEGYAALWGSPEDRDIAGMYANSASNYEESGRKIPILFYFHSDETHAFERKIAEATVVKTEFGLWVDAEWVFTEVHESLIQYVAEMILREVYHFAPATTKEDAVIADDRYVMKFPLHGIFLTPMPSQ